MAYLDTLLTAKTSMADARKYISNAVKGAEGERAVRRLFMALKQSRYMRKYLAKRYNTKFNEALSPKEHVLIKEIVRRVPGRYPALERMLAQLKAQRSST